MAQNRAETCGARELGFKEGDESAWSEVDVDDDGLGIASSAASVDKLYLGETAADAEANQNGTSSSSAQRWKIQHGAGDYKYSLSRFITQVLSKDFDGLQALEILQRRCTMNYGSPKIGSGPAKPSNNYSHSFYLDFISIIGRPLQPITKKSARPFDNVIVSFKYWRAPYSVKHAKGIPLDMTNRTFRLGESATREKWFLVMHPKETRTISSDEHGKKNKRPKRSAMEWNHAYDIAEYIKSLFLDTRLVGEGIEASWKLGGKEEKVIAFNRWAIFQTLFMDHWKVFVSEHADDKFWLENSPAFHAYDYGANIEIEVTDKIRSLEREVPVRPVDDEDIEDNTSESEDNAEAEEYVAHERPSERSSPMTAGCQGSNGVADSQDTTNYPSTPLSERHIPKTAVTATSIGGPEVIDDSAIDEWSQLLDNDLFVSSDDEYARDEIYNDVEAEGLYSDGLRQLRTELEQKYELDHIDVISYALAVNISCESSDPTRSSTPASSQSAIAYSVASPRSVASTTSNVGPEKASLLADRNYVVRQYTGKNDFTFYSLGFHPAYGNFSSPEPPRFLANGPLAIIKDNMSFQNNGSNILEAGYWQAYSNLKRSIRHTGEDLLATQGSATAAFTIPIEDAKSRAPVTKTQQKLLERVRGELTPDDPGASTPFARERKRIEAAIASKSYAYHFEQVLSVNVKRLTAERRTFATVLHPIFELMRFFLQEKTSYIGLLRQFPPVAFPGVLAGFARVFELALKEMDARFRHAGSQGLDLALSEGVAALDRLGNFCFTGDPAVLPTKVLRPLKTVDSLREGGWPFIATDMLDIRGGRGFINLRKWPRSEDQRPLLMHVAALVFYNGEQIATNRQSQLWFTELGGNVIYGVDSLTQFMNEVLGRRWIDDMKAFVTYQTQQRLNRGVRGSHALIGADRQQVAEARAALDRWESSWNPFSWANFEALSEDVLSIAVNEMAIRVEDITPRTRYDVAKDLFTALQGNGPLTAFASKHSQWAVILRAAIQHTKRQTITQDQWISSLAGALQSLGIEWMPGSYGGYITCRRVVRLVGSAPKTTPIVTGQPGSLKRLALEAEAQYKAREQRPKKAKRRKVDFGCPIPFREVPELILKGFREQKKKGNKVSERVLSHYQVALQCLQESLRDPICDVLLILVMTVCSCSERLDVKESERQWSPSDKPNNSAMMAACLVTRMLWFMRKDAFPWAEDEGQVLRVPEMIKKMEHKGNLRMLRQMRWIRQIRGTRATPKMDEVDFETEDKLMQLRKNLISAMKEPESFFELVIGSSSPIWMARFASIIVEY